MKSAFVKNDTRYTFCFSDNGEDNFIYLAVSAVNLAWETIYKIPVRENANFAYKINKKSISAAGGSYGLMKYLNRCIINDFNMCSVFQIIESVTKNIKGMEV